jgi:formylglycine-generating enzyme required for sulfatase activity
MNVGGTAPVGGYPTGASPYGLLDMAGNVYERVERDDGRDRPFITRGGSFYRSGDLSCIGSAPLSSGRGFIFVGFRVVAPRP